MPDLQPKALATGPSSGYSTLALAIARLGSQPEANQRELLHGLGLALDARATAYFRAGPDLSELQPAGYWSPSPTAAGPVGIEAELLARRLGPTAPGNARPRVLRTRPPLLAAQVGRSDHPSDQYGWLVAWWEPDRSPGPAELGLMQTFASLMAGQEHQRRQQAELAETRAVLDMVTESMRDVVYQVDVRGVVVYVSPSCQRVLGQHPTEVIGRSIFADVHPGDCGHAKQGPGLPPYPPAGHPEPHPEATVCSLRCRHADGRWLWMESVIRVLRDEQGQVTGAVVARRDITARHQAEAEARRAASDLETLFQAVPDSVVLLDVSPDGVCRYRRINPMTERMVSMPTSDIIGRTVLEVRGPSARPLLDALERCISTREPTEYHLSRQGIYWHTVLHPIVVDGRVTQIVKSSRNVTALHQRDQALRASEERFRRLAENAHDLIYRVCPTDDGGLRTEYMNPAIQTMAGYSPQEFYDDPFLPGRIIHPDDREALAQALGDTGPEAVVLRWRHRDGHWVYIEHKHLMVLDGEGQAAAVEGIGRDITERLRLEENVRHLSYYDKLTGLMNRARFEESLESHENCGTVPLSIILGDLNGLKVINDAFGHPEGDRLLVRASSLLRGSLPPGSLLCRWGGDEFAILLPGTDELGSFRVSAAIRQTFAAAPEDPVRPSIALGVATRLDTSKTTIDLLAEAEDRMYRNKLVETRSAHSAVIASLERTLAERTHETEEHARRMERLCRSIGAELGLPDSDMADLSLLAILHDVGKVAIPDNILNHPGSLDAQQWEVMRRHPEIGYRITSSCPDLAHIAPAVLSHHERWDGRGYPQGLAGNEIPRIARILAVADAYDVMVHGRPYRAPVEPREAMAELRRCAGTQFDPVLVNVLHTVVGRLPQLFGAGEDRTATLGPEDRS